MIKYFINDKEITPNTVKGWRDGNISVLRNDMKGIYREVTQELEFVKYGARVLRDAVYTLGINAEISLKIIKVDKLTLQEIQIFDGFFDLSTFQDNADTVTCTAIDKGINSILKSKENQEYAIELTDEIILNNTKDWHGKSIHSGATLPVAFIPTFSTPLNLNAGRYKLEAFSNIRKIDGIYNTLDVIQGNNVGFGFFEVLQSNSVTCRFRITIPTHKVIVGMQVPTYNPVLNNGFTFKIQLVKLSNPIVQYDLYQTTATLVSGTDGGFNTLVIPDINELIQNIDAVAGDTFVLIFGVLWDETTYNNSGNQRITHEAVATVESDVASILPAVTVKSFNAYEMFIKIIEQIDDTIQIKSDYLLELTSQESNSIPYFTSGEALRQLENPKIRISLKQYYDAMNSHYPIGIGVETFTDILDVSTDRVVIEDEAYFYNESEFYDIGTAKRLEVSPMPIVTSLKVGNVYEDLETPSGRDAFNSEQKWLMPFDKLKENQQDILSPVITDYISILQTYLNGAPTFEDFRTFEPKERADDTTLDRLKDNKTFMIDCTYNVNRDRFEQDTSKNIVIQGVQFDDFVFNVKYTPRRSIIANAPTIASYLYPGLSPIVQTSFAKSVALISQITGETTPKQESDDINYSELGNPRFKPFMMQVTVAQPQDVYLKLLKFNGLVKFKYLGNEYYGFIDDVAFKIFDRGEITVNLKASRFSNITKLIR